MRASELEFIWEQRSPVIAINSSQDVQRLCAENQIGSLAELLTPFSCPLPQSISIKRINGQTQNIPDFCVRFVDLLRLDSFTPAALVEKISQQLIKESNKMAPDKKTLCETIDLIKDSGEPPNIERQTPWFSEFRHSFCEAIGVQEYETFAHPVAILHAVSTASQDPVNEVLSLLDTRNWPGALQRGGLVDADVLAHIVLVHDVRATNVDPQTIIAKIQRATNVPSCSVFTVNSAAGGTADPAKDIWYDVVTDRQLSIKRYLNASSLDDSDILDSESMHKQAITRCGKLLSSTDVESMQCFVVQLVSRHIIPFMEQQIALWNDSLGANKRGFTGRLFSASKKYFGGGYKTPLVPVALLGTTMEMYPLQSPEAILRKLADYAFMLRDFRYANSIYSSVLLDFQKNHPQSVRYVLGVQQMIGLCQLVLRCVEPDRMPSGSFFSALNTAGSGEIASKSAKHIFEVIFGSSKELSNPGTSTGSPRSAKSDSFESNPGISGIVQHGSLIWHTVFLYYEALKASKDRSDLAANMLLGLIYNEDPSLAPESSLLSNALLFEQASLAFLTCSPPLWRRFAFRQSLAGDTYARLQLKNHALRCFYGVEYMNIKWAQIRDHTLGQLGELHPDPFSFLFTLAQENDQPSEIQDQIVEKAVLASHKQQITVVTDARLPGIQCQQLSYEAVLGQASLIGTSSILAAENEQWLELEKSLITDGMNPQLLRDKSQPLPEPDRSKSLASEVLGAIGEPLYCHINFTNPLKIDIQLSKVYLVVGVINSDGSVSSMPVNLAQVDPTADLLVQQHCDIDFMPLIFLPSSSSLSFALKVIPKAVGRLKILALSYNLFGRISCYRTLKPVANVVPSLDIRVSSPMPVIEAKLMNLPPIIYSGEMTSGILEISNKGNAQFSYLTAKISQPSFISISHEPISVNVGAPEEPIYCTDNAKVTETFAVENDLDTRSISIVQLQAPADAKVLLYKVWLRGDKIGKYSIKIILGYRSTNSSQDGYRTTQCVLNFQVIPCLRINAFTRPSLTAANEFVLGIEIENLQTDKQACFEQLLAVSKHWKMEPLTQDGPKQAIINPRETAVLFFRLCPNSNYFRSCKDPRNTSDWSCASQLQQFVTRREEVGRKFSKNKWLEASYGNVDMGVSLWKRRDLVIDAFSPLLLHFMLAARTNWRLSSLKAAFPFVSPKLLPMLFPRYSLDDIDLSLFWTLEPNKVRGHHFVIGINLGLPNILPFQVSCALIDEYLAASPAEKGPLPIYFVHSAKFAQFMVKRALFVQTANEKTALLNNFTRMPSGSRDLSPVAVLVVAPENVYLKETFGIVNIKVHLVNSAWHSAALASFEFNSSVAGLNTDNSLISLNRPQYHWIGETGFKTFLNPGEKVELEFKAAVFSNGIYDFGKWTITSCFAAGTASNPFIISHSYVQQSPGSVIVRCQSQTSNLV